MYPIPPSEHLLEERKCRQCSTPFPITDTDMEFYGKVSPVFPSLPDKGGVTSETSDGGLVSFSENGYKTPPFSGLPPFSGEQRPYLIPPPTLCPDCRQQRRLAFRNERRLYKRKCDATGKDIVSIYSPDKPYRVYHQDYWWSDAWDPMKYGRGFDFERSAMEQFGELMREVPKQAINGF